MIERRVGRALAPVVSVLVLAACEGAIKVGDWPSDATQGPDASWDAARDEDGGFDGGVDGGELVVDACPRPWLLVTLSGERGRIARFSLAERRLRCDDLDAGGALDAELLDADALDDEVVIAVSAERVFAISAADDTLRWSVPFTFEHESPRAEIAILEGAAGPFVYIAYGSDRGDLRRFVIIEDGVLREVTLDLPNAEVPFAVSPDLERADHLLFFTNHGVWRVEPRSGVAVAAIGGVRTVNALAAHVRRWPQPRLIVSRPVNLWRLGVAGDVLEGESQSAPTTCSLDIRDALPHPAYDGEDFVLCGAETVLALPVGSATGDVVVSATAEGASAIRGLGVLALPPM